MPSHIVSASDLSTAELAAIFERAHEFKEMGLKKRFFSPPSLKGRVIALLFDEPSTRTRTSFEIATYRLGGNVVVLANASTVSSAAKGERLEDTIRVISEMADAIVLRHPEEGAAARAAAVSSVPVVNAGDGAGEHPTQAFVDLFTIWEAARERLPKKPLRVQFFGDNAHSRTVNSLASLLASHAKALGIEILDVTFTGGEHRTPKKTVVENLRAAGIAVQTIRAWGEDFDVIYVTRPQRERHDTNDKTVVPMLALSANAPKHAIILHPLPRTSELPTRFDSDARAWYFRQAENGLYVRMALLEFLLSQ